MEMSMQMQQEPAAEVKTPLRVGEYLSRDVPVTNKCGTVIATFAERHYAEMAVRAVNNFDALVEAGNKVLAGLNERIDKASRDGAPVPVFDGIGELHDALIAAAKE